jgi:uncharacterized protein (TIGR03435 family)
MFTTLNKNLSDLIKFAWDMHPKQVIGAPAWVDSDKFDILAKPDTPGMPGMNQMKAMVRKLLADRFNLQFHHEKRELSVYAITVAKGGEKIKKDENSTLPLPGFGGPPQRGFNVHNATIAEFASVMQAQFMEQPVVDQTGLGDTRYTFTLKWTPILRRTPASVVDLRPMPHRPRKLTPRPTCSARWYSSLGSKWERPKHRLM